MLPFPYEIFLNPVKMLPFVVWSF